MIDFVRAYKIIGMVCKETNEMDVAEFGSIMAMIVEEWCAHNKEFSPSELFTDMAKIAEEVKDLLGDYKPVT